MSLRIGVFVCNCGTNIGGTVNVPEVVRYAETLPNVVCAMGNLYTCSEDGLSAIRNKIKERNLNRVVVASCTPRTHEPLFKKNCERAGLNKYLFEFVNLREHCSWVHLGRPVEATAKAKDLVRMGVAKVSLLTSQQDQSTAVTPATLVIGGGVSGLSAALTLANQGYRVELVEKQNRLGGLLQNVNILFPSDQSAAALLTPLVEAVSRHDNIRVHLQAEVAAVKGFIGNFTALVRLNGQDEEFNIGTIIVAVGAEELKPHGLMGYGRFSNVITQLELEERLKNKYDGFTQVVMINCVGARSQDRTYCGRFCCVTAMKNASLIKSRRPETSVRVLHRDVMACGKIFEEYYQKALSLGVQFIRFNREQPPRITGAQNKAGKVTVIHELTGKKAALETDLVVLTAPLVPAKDNRQLSRMLKIPLGNEGFFMEAHQKLRPVEFPADGIFIAGCARYPTDISECVAQGYAAAAKAAVPMARRQVVTEAFTSEVNPLRCSACGRCVEICPFGAVGWIESRNSEGGTVRIARVNSTECKGCGLCAASCLSGALQLKGFTDEQILAMVGAGMEGHRT
ncbi:MAG: CoB--CoM heterodisulfide reductase iron-sulfur subunit A family protein [Thermodesulfobacteriota bacterium]